MALEDRCSPQSAPSPPGIPHSPQSTSSSLILDMSMQHYHHHNHQHHHQQQQQQQQQQQLLHNPYTISSTSSNLYDNNQMKMNEVSQFHQKMALKNNVRNLNDDIDDRLTPKSDEHFDGPIIKQENDNDSIMDDDNDNHEHKHEHDHEDEIPTHHINQSPPAAISFSILNILSDKIGVGKTKSLTKLPIKLPESSSTIIATENTTNIMLNKKPLGQQIFRPFEIRNKSHDEIPNKERSAFKQLVNVPTDILDYSRTHQQHHQHQHHHQYQQHHQMSQHAAAAAAAAVMMAERANFLNCFNPASYPRIHEEILNSTRKFQNHKQHQHQHSSSSTTSAIQHLPNDNKMPPLGSLCKTVSQIGQTATNLPPPPPSSSSSSTTSAIHHHHQSMFMSSPPPASVSSMSMSSSSASSTASASPLCRLPNSSPQPIPPPPPQSISRDSGMESSDDTRSENDSNKDENGQLWPAWVYCTRYSDRPSSGPRYRRPKKEKDPKAPIPDEKRPRTAFSSDQLARLKREFNENRYLTERRRLSLSTELGLNEAQIKIWFQNKRAKIKKTSGSKNPLALQLMAQGLYNHSTVPLTAEEEELEMRMNGQL